MSQIHIQKSKQKLFPLSTVPPQPCPADYVYLYLVWYFIGQCKPPVSGQHGRVGTEFMSNSGDAMSHGRIIDAVSQSLQPPHYTNKVAQIAFTLKPIG